MEARKSSPSRNVSCLRELLVMLTLELNGGCLYANMTQGFEHAEQVKQTRIHEPTVSSLFEVNEDVPGEQKFCELS
jgi:hypothetical protein